MGRDPFERVWTLIAVAIALIVVLSLLGLPSGWVPIVLGWILPGVVLGIIAGLLARAVTKEISPAVATGGVVFALTVLFRILLWVDARVG